MGEASTTALASLQKRRLMPPSVIGKHATRLTACAAINCQRRIARAKLPGRADLKPFFGEQTWREV